nr:hypothetical protein [Acidobacteriota bacterium]
SLIAAAPIDDGFAQAIRELAEAEAVLLDAGGVPGTSLRSGQVPWKSLADFRAAGGLPGRALDVPIGAALYTAWEVTLVREPEIAAVILASRADRAGRYRAIQTGVLGIGLAMAVLILFTGALALRLRNPR